MNLQKPQRLNSRETFLIGLTLVVGFALFNYFVVLPWYGQIKADESRLIAVRKTLDGQIKKIQETPQREAKLKSFQKNEPQSTAHIENEASWDKFMGVLAKECKSTRSKERDYTNTDSKKVLPYKADYKLEGPLDGIIKFLHLLITDSSHPQIETCVIQPSRIKNNLSVQLKTSVFLKNSTAAQAPKLPAKTPAAPTDTKALSIPAKKDGK